MDLRAIKLDETMNWVIPDWMEKFVDKIYGIYLYDRDKTTYCCSSTPCYELILIRYDFTLKDGLEVEDDLLEKADDYVSLSESEDVSYMNQSLVPKGMDLNEDIPDNLESNVKDIQEYGSELSANGVISAYAIKDDNPLDVITWVEKENEQKA